MKDLFYIVEVRPQWYNLIVKDTHYCVSCGSDLEKIKRTIYNYVRKYKVDERVLRALRGLEDSGRVPPTVFEKRQKDYDSGKHIVFNDLVRGVVEEALKENRKDTPYHKTKKKVGHITPRHEERSCPLPPTNEVKVVKKITPLKIRRTTA